jgi:DhnA family fructose-bisphosphate aldolase class Ia
MVSKLSRRKVSRLAIEGGVADMIKAEIRQASPLVFHCEGENQLYSPALEAAGVHYTGGAISINAECVGGRLPWQATNFWCSLV